MRDSVKIVIACIVCLGVVGAAGIYVYFSRNQKQKDRKVVTRPYGDVVQWKYEDEDDTKWRELMNLDVLKVDGEAPALRVEDGYIQYEKSEGEWVNLIPLDSLAGAAGSEGIQGAQGEQGTQGIQGPKGDKGDDGRSVELRASNGYVQWRYTNENDWKNLIAVAALSGSNGQDGRSVEVRNNGSAIVWRYEGESDASWRPIMALAALRGEIGPTGEPGISGVPGAQGPAGEDGVPGADGRPVEVDVIDGAIQWRYEGDENWKNLVSVADLTGAKGEAGADAKQVELKKSDDGLSIMWKYTSDDDSKWETLITVKNGVDGAKGADGREVEITVRPEVTADPDNNISAQKADIAWRYTTGDDTSWKHMIDIDDLKGEPGDLFGNIELRVTTIPVQVFDAEGNPVTVTVGTDPDTGEPITEPKMQDEKWIQWKSTEASVWNDLCPLSDLNVTIPTPAEKFSKTITSEGDITGLDSAKTYLVTMSFSAKNTTANDITASLSCAGQTVIGTWKAATQADDSDPDNVIPAQDFFATYSTSFTVSGVSSVTAAAVGTSGLDEVSYLISVVEI
ncbi:MAG: collagen-like protein [Clostridiales bacterium]|nr:collagen-like protein [Clostridiales bacterium]